ncbi:hypothetical protein SprV_0200750700 [Sparganum proliferum]
MPIHAYREELSAIDDADLTDGKLLTIPRPKASLKNSVHDPVLADDYALNTTTEDDMKWNLNLLAPDNPRSKQPTLVARELARYKVDIAARSQTRFSEQGQLEEPTPPTNLRRTPPHPDQHLLPSPDAREGHLDAPRSRQWRLLDYVLVRRRNQRAVLVTKAIPGAEGWIDHCLVIFKMRIRLQPRKRPQDAADENVSMENRWCQLRSAVQSTALAVLGRARRQHQEWFDDNDAAISKLLAEKNTLHKACVNCPTEDNRAAFYSGKIFAHILLNRLNIHLEQGLLPESQCDIRRRRGTTDMIFVVRQLQKKCQEMRTHLYSTFVDLRKAFGMVNHEGLFKIMPKFGCPEKLTQMMRFKSRVSTTTVHELLFADDCALSATTEGDMQRSMYLFSAACENLGLIINTKKTVVMHQPPPDAAYVAPQLNVNGVQLQVVDNFTYLCSTLARSTKIDDELSPTEVAGPDHRHRRTWMDRQPQQLLYAETTTTTLERTPRTDGRRKATQPTLLWRCRYGFTPTRSPSPALRGYSVNLPEAPADQAGKLGRPPPGPTYVEESSEDRCSNIRSQPHHRRQS